MSEGEGAFLDAGARDSRLAVLSDRRRDGSGTPLVIGFHDLDRECSFGEADVAFALALLHLPADGCLPVAHVSGSLRGADLALALLCPLVVLDGASTLGSGFGRPGSAAVYVAASRRMGTVACERLLFADAVLDAAGAAQAHLAVIADGVAGAAAVATARRSTLLAIAKANLVTWPMPRDAVHALVDEG